MYLGFALAAYAVVGNDVIQTLGVFLSSNSKRPWYILWLFAGGIMAFAVIYGWSTSSSQRVVLEGEYVQVEGQDYYLNYRHIKENEELPSKFFPMLVYPSEWGKMDEEEQRAFLGNKEYITLTLFQKEGESFSPLKEISARVMGTFQLEFQEGQKTERVSLRNRQIHDVSFDRLERYDYPFEIAWWYLLPPLVLLIITRFGIPVSTTFLILTFFSPKELESMLIKSLSGYAVAFGAAVVFYFLISKRIEQRFFNNTLDEKTRNGRIWTAALWLSTGYLWWNWLSQDFANIYAYLDRDVDVTTLVISVVLLLTMLAYIFAQRGGKIQEIVTSKTNVTDIRSSALINVIYGTVLLIFKEWSNVPMSTTWVFLGLLAGREYAIRYQVFKKIDNKLHKMIGRDLGKAFLGLVVSIALVFLIRALETT